MTSSSTAATQGATRDIQTQVEFERISTIYRLAESVSSYAIPRHFDSPGQPRETKKQRPAHRR